MYIACRLTEIFTINHLSTNLVCYNLQHRTTMIITARKSTYPTNLFLALASADAVAKGNDFPAGHLITSPSPVRHCCLTALLFTTSSSDSPANTRNPALPHRSIKLIKDTYYANFKKKNSLKANFYEIF